LLVSREEQTSVSVDDLARTVLPAFSGRETRRRVDRTVSTEISQSIVPLAEPASSQTEA
jgi:hypothetical protein